MGRRFSNVGLHPHLGKIILRLGVLWLKVEDLERRFGLSLLLLLWYHCNNYKVKSSLHHCNKYSDNLVSIEVMYG